MDRIKQALDRARAESKLEGRDREGMRATSGSARTADTHLGESQIKYSQTQVNEIKPVVLRENRIVLGDADRVGVAAYKMLRTQVLHRMTENGWNALAITSPAPGEGKSVTASNLAISLARELHHTVLLVDMDLRNPSIHKIFGLNFGAGIGDYLLRGRPMGEILVNPGIERLVILPGAESIENSSEILASPAVGELVKELKSRYPARMIIFDLPPVLSADDALSFAPFVDAFLLVVRDAQTTGASLQRTMELMKDATILGTVLNDSNEKISGYY